MYYFDPKGIEIKIGTSVIVETQKGIEFGECVMENCEVDDEKIIPPLKSVLRIATDNDINVVKQNAQKELAAADIFIKRVESHNLEMKFIDVEYSFDNSKIVFYFTADGRIDFRDLVKDLASVFRTRIELRQIGVRDEARMLGGFGVCGKPFCCATFLDDFQPVSIGMAKKQGLPLNPTKISGTCGRLMCCLKFEQAAYDDLIATTPPEGSTVKTPQGNGIVTETYLLRGELKVLLDSAPDMPPKVFPKCSCELVKSCPHKKEHENEQPTV